MLSAELNRSRGIGVEYEMCLPLVGTGGGNDVQQVVARVLTANGLPAIARGYSHAPLPAGIDLAVEYDGSVQGQSEFSGITFHSVELKTRILNGIDEWERIVPKALAICRYLGARVNRTCGHHVHLSLDEVTSDPRVLKSLFNLIHRFDNCIFSVVAPSRRTCGYAQPIPHQAKYLHGCRTLACFRRALTGWDRRTALNLTHVFEDSPHVEYRYHQGTLDADKARHWLRMCLQLTEHSVKRNCQATTKQVENSRSGLERLLVSCGFKVNAGIYAQVSPELRETGRYLLKRYKAFNGPQSLRPSTSQATKHDADARELA